jgi:hypothetical protein
MKSIMSRPNVEFRTRKHGTNNQIGKKFPIIERGSKANLPRGLKQVFEPRNTRAGQGPFLREKAGGGALTAKPFSGTAYSGQGYSGVPYGGLNGLPKDTYKGARPDVKKPKLKPLPNVKKPELKPHQKLKPLPDVKKPKLEPLPKLKALPNVKGARPSLKQLPNISKSLPKKGRDYAY